MPPKTTTKTTAKSPAKKKTSQKIKYPKILGPTGLPPTFQCGNHDPAHIAHSIEEIMELNKQESCTRFHIIFSEPIM